MDEVKCWRSMGVLLFTLFDNEIMLINLAINLGTKTGLQIMQSNFSQKKNI